MSDLRTIGDTLNFMLGYSHGYGRHDEPSMLLCPADVCSRLRSALDAFYRLVCVHCGVPLDVHEDCAPAAVVDQEETPHVYRSTCGLDCNGEETPC